MYLIYVSKYVKIMAINICHTSQYSCMWTMVFKAKCDQRYHTTKIVNKHPWCINTCIINIHHYIFVLFYDINFANKNNDVIFIFFLYAQFSNIKEFFMFIYASLFIYFWRLWCVFVIIHFNLYFYIILIQYINSI